MEDLTQRPVAKRPSVLRFEGRILYLVDDAELMRRQLDDGENLTDSPELRAKLRDQISTDEITPAYICYFYDETLGDFPVPGPADHEPRQGETEYPVSTRFGDDGGFVCSVAGKRRGKGSSREQSPTPSSWPESRWSSARASSASTTRTARTWACSPPPTSP